MSYCEKSFFVDHGGQKLEMVSSIWGDSNKKTILCLHGLTGNGRDFDWIAPNLVEAGYKVVAPDLIGRGRSDFAPYPCSYNYRQYLSDIHVI
mgnify:FL=1